MPTVENDLPTSPRIETLRREVASAGASAIATLLDEFWSDVEAEGTPLIERVDPIEPAGEGGTGAEEYLTTFLYRDGGGARRNVVVCSHALGWSFGRNQMQRLPGTDVWYRTYRLPSGLRTAYWLSPDDSLEYLIDMEDRAERTSNWGQDPFARHTFFFPRDEEIPGDEDYRCSMLEMPGVPAPSWSAPEPNALAGRVEEFRVQSRILENERRVSVYTPPSYDHEKGPYRLLLLFDGFAYLHVIPTPTILDNLLAAGKLPPFVALLVNNVDRNRELPCYPPFADFLAGELLPWARERFGVSPDPAHVVVGGSSYGGLAAAFAGFRHPETFGNVLSQSGAFWWRPESHAPGSSTEPHEWLIRQFVAGERLPLRFYLDVGTLENGFKDPSMLVANRHMRDVLWAKGYPCVYAEYLGGHDYPCWEITLPEGLLALTGADARAIDAIDRR